ncbi:MAG: hypothetical protein ABII22_05215 [Candidatus Micrarchaeota archaeon]
MKKIVLVLLSLMVLSSFLYSEQGGSEGSGISERSEQTISVTSERASEDSSDNSMEVRTEVRETVRSETEVDSESGTFSSETVETTSANAQVRETNRERVEVVKAVREQIKSECDSRTGSDRSECQVRLTVATAVRCEDVNGNISYGVCTKSLEKIAENKCEDLDGDAKNYCERKVTAYGKEYIVRERYELSEQCRDLTGQGRSDCQVAVNTQFREEVKSRFQVWNEQNVSKEKQVRVRAIVVSRHQESVQKIKQNSSEKQVRLLARLDASMEQMNRWAEKMDKLVQRANEKGHDTVQLEFLVSDFQSSLDDAMIYYDEQQYQDALASIDYAGEDVAEFKAVLKEVIKSDKAGTKYKSNEIGVSE